MTGPILPAFLKLHRVKSPVVMKLQPNDRAIGRGTCMIGSTSVTIVKVPILAKPLAMSFENFD